MLFEFRCRACGTLHAQTYGIGKAPSAIRCQCQEVADRHFSASNVFQWTEDRTRFFQGARGDGWSYALGEYMPESRAERDRLAKKKGVEFISGVHELGKDAQDAVAYGKEVKAGMKPDAWEAPDTSAAWKPGPPEGLTL